MLNTTDLSMALSKTLSRNLGFDEETESILLFGFDLLLSALGGFIVIAFIGLVVGALRQTLGAAFATAAVRVFSGGAHCSSAGRCQVAGGLVFPLFGLVALWAERSIYHHSSVLDSRFIPIWLALILMVHVFRSPVPSKSKNLTHRKRLVLKGGAVAVAALVGLLAGTTLVNPAVPDTHLEWALGSFLGVTWQTFTVLPVSEGLVKRFDRILSLAGIR